MTEITIYGASDDLIEIDGAIREEFGCVLDVPGESAIIAVSDGTLLRVRYDEDGIWRFTPSVLGSSSIAIAPGMDDRLHSDRVILRGDNLTWVVLALEVAK
jgi:hypothetical protein